MTDDYSSESGSRRDSFVPLLLLSISVIVISVSVILLAKSYSNMLDWQTTNATKQQSMLQDAITRQKPAVDQSKQVQAGLAKLATDLLDAAKTDDTAKAIAAKYIRANGSPAPSAAPAASP